MESIVQLIDDTIPLQEWASEIPSHDRQGLDTSPSASVLLDSIIADVEHMAAERQVSVLSISAQHLADYIIRHSNAMIPASLAIAVAGQLLRRQQLNRALFASLVLEKSALALVDAWNAHILGLFPFVDFIIATQRQGEQRIAALAEELVGCSSKSRARGKRDPLGNLQWSPLFVHIVSALVHMASSGEKGADCAQKIIRRIQVQMEVKTSCVDVYVGILNAELGREEPRHWLEGEVSMLLCHTGKEGAISMEDRNAQAELVTMMHVASDAMPLDPVFHLLYHHFSPSYLVYAFGKAITSRRVQWKNVVTFAHKVATLAPASLTLFVAHTRELLEAAIASGDSMGIARVFVLARHVFALQLRRLEEEQECISYGSWFDTMFVDTTTRIAESHRAQDMIGQVLCAMVPLEQRIYLTFHSRVVQRLEKAKELPSTYRQLARVRLSELGVSSSSAEWLTGEEEDVRTPRQVALEDTRRLVQAFVSTGQVPSAIMQAYVFRKKWYLETFVPTLLHDIPDQPARTGLIEALIAQNKLKKSAVSDVIPTSSPSSIFPVAMPTPTPLSQLHLLLDGFCTTMESAHAQRVLVLLETLLLRQVSANTLAEELMGALERNAEQQEQAGRMVSAIWKAAHKDVQGALRELLETKIRVQGPTSSIEAITIALAHLEEEGNEIVDGIPIHSSVWLMWMTRLRASIVMIRKQSPVSWLRFLLWMRFRLALMHTICTPLEKALAVLSTSPPELMQSVWTPQEWIALESSVNGAADIVPLAMRLNYMRSGVDYYVKRGMPSGTLFEQMLVHSRHQPGEAVMLLLLQDVTKHSNDGWLLKALKHFSNEECWSIVQSLNPSLLWKSSHHDLSEWLMTMWKHKYRLWPPAISQHLAKGWDGEWVMLERDCPVLCLAWTSHPVVLPCEEKRVTLWKQSPWISAHNVLYNGLYPPPMWVGGFGAGVLSYLQYGKAEALKLADELLHHKQQASRVVRLCTFYKEESAFARTVLERLVDKMPDTLCLAFATPVHPLIPPPSLSFFQVAHRILSQRDPATMAAVMGDQWLSVVLTQHILCVSQLTEKVNTEQAHYVVRSTIRACRSSEMQIDVQALAACDPETHAFLVRYHRE